MVCPPGIGIRVSGDPGHAERSQQRLPGSARQKCRKLGRGSLRSRHPDLEALVSHGVEDRGGNVVGVTTGSARGRARPSIIAVSTSAGCTTVNATPLLLYSSRSDSVRPTMPCLVAEYVALPGSGTRPAPEAMLTRCPLWRGSIRWSASLDPRVVP